MTDLKIPNLNKNSDKYLFKKKLTLRIKSKKKLIKEAFLMFSLSILIIYINYLIPNKKLVFENFFNNISKLVEMLLESFSYFYDVSLTVFIFLSLTLSLFLIMGTLSRLLKLVKRKTKQISFK